ncbi:MAG: hypothetical protein K2I64_02580 [Muribaculaceae bacterium]|nr:hypothetical protein [Muribaculaceae bacterium]
MTFTLKSTIKYLAMGLFAATISCSEEPDLSGQNDDSSVAPCVTFRCSDMLEVYKGADNPASRAGGPKSPKEKQINTIHVFFFDYDSGELLQSNPQNFSSYQKLNLASPGNQAFITIPTGTGADLFAQDYSKVRIVAIANIDATDDAASPEADENSFRTQYSSNGCICINGRTESDDNPVLEIANYADLQKWVYYPPIRMSDDGTYGDISQLPAAGMPMIGESSGAVNLTAKPASPIVVNMRALMAKVNVSVELDPEQFTSDLPTLTITEYGVMNMPVAVPFVEPKGGLRQGKSWTQPDVTDLAAENGYFETYDVTRQPMFHKGDPGDWQHNSCSAEAHEFTTAIDPVTINKDAPPVTFSYYTYENVNMPNFSAQRASASGADKPAFTAGNYTVAATGETIGFTPNYPDGISESDHQRWKPTLAYEHRASALILKGSYTTHQGLTYQAQFTIYLGRDTDIDFQVRRNYRYDNNIIIKGLEYVRNSTDDVYTFDGRVNLKYDNPLYLAVVNERHVDAHASALPMDVWLMNYEDFTPEPDNYYTDVTVTIPETCSEPGVNPRDWVQMVMIPREEMQEKSQALGAHEGRFVAGAGAEKYFYTYLIDDIKAKKVLTPNEGGAYEGHSPEAQCGHEVTISCTPAVNNSRSRVYFYIDENVGNLGDGSDRSVDVEVKYHAYLRNPDGTRSDEVTYTRYLTIEQRGLLRVPGSHPGGSGSVPETYIEYYEEYLDHSDPLEEHESGEVYKEGLSWGLENVNVFRRGTTNRDGFNNGNDDSDQVYTKSSAFAMMRWVFNRSGVEPLGHLFSLTQDDKPASAFHYCLGKNKRKYDGSADIATSGTRGWYMPGIRELETAIVQYYTIFDDFQGKKYWSAACGEPESKVLIWSHDYTHARATKVEISDNEDGTQSTDYMESSYGKDGYELRVNEHRIRAFYSKN